MAFARRASPASVILVFPKPFASVLVCARAAVAQSLQGNTMKISLRRNAAAFGLCAALMLSTAACTKTGNTATISTSELNADVAAITFAAQAIEAVPAIESHLTDAQKLSITNALTNIKNVAAQVAANSNGSVAINVGKKWVNDLVPEFQTILAIAAPIVKQYDPTVAGYMTTVEQIIPLVEALVGVSTTSTSVALTAVAPHTAPAIRARIYQGP